MNQQVQTTRADEQQLTVFLRPKRSLSSHILHFLRTKRLGAVGAILALFVLIVAKVKSLTLGIIWIYNIANSQIFDEIPNGFTATSNDGNTNQTSRRLRCSVTFGSTLDFRFRLCCR